MSEILKSQKPETIGQKWLLYGDLSVVTLKGYASELAYTLEQDGVFAKDPGLRVLIEDNIEFLEEVAHQTPQVMSAIHENLEGIEWEQMAREAN